MDNYLSHNNVCSEDLTKCKYDCGELTKQRFIETHYKLFCPNALVNCPCCSTNVERRRLLYEREFNSSNDIGIDRKIKELKDELMLKNEEINKLIVKKQNNLSSFAEKEILQLDLKNILNNKSNNIQVINFIEYFKNSERDFLVFSISTGELITYDLTNLKIESNVKIHDDNISDLKKIHYTDTNITYVITSSFDSKINIINPLSISDRKIQTLEAPATCILINPFNDLAILGDTAGFIRLLSIENLELIISRKVPISRVILIQYSQNREFILSFSKSKTLSKTGFNIKYELTNVR